jgi:hypothetical protein
VEDGGWGLKIRDKGLEIRDEGLEIRDKRG